MLIIIIQMTNIQFLDYNKDMIIMIDGMLSDHPQIQSQEHQKVISPKKNQEAIDLRIGRGMIGKIARDRSSHKKR